MPTERIAKWVPVVVVLGLTMALGMALSRDLAMSQEDDGEPAGPVAPRALQQQAVGELVGVEAESDSASNHLERARSQYRRALENYRDPVHPADEGAFDADKKGTRALHSLLESSKQGGSSPERFVDAADQASEAVVEGSERAVRWQLEAAERMFAAHEANLDQGERTQLQQKLDNASAAFARAQRTRDGNGGNGNGGNSNGQGGQNNADAEARKTVKRRAKAMPHYQTGWRHATTVVQRIAELDVDSTRADSDGDGLFDPLEDQLGTDPAQADSDADGLSDYLETAGGLPLDTDRDATLDALDTDSDGDQIPDWFEGADFAGLDQDMSREAADADAADTDTDGDGFSDFRDPDDDGDGIATTVEFDDSPDAMGRHDVDLDRVPNWRDTDADGDDRPDGEEGRADHDDDGIPAYLDNDADNDLLPDFYERDVTATDPDDADSDSARTEADESDDDVIDGNEDFDGDDLPTKLEYGFDTDPFDVDSDGDGLTDGFEHAHDELDPGEADTDGDGASDGEEDFDDDGLANLDEDESDTDPWAVDTDDDRLDDAAEGQHGTEPLDRDTDDDGIEDGAEIELGTDPLSADSDGDGVPDSDETHTVTKSAEDTDATVTATGSPDIATQLSVTKVAQDEPDEFRRSSVIRVDNRADVDEATVSFAVPDDVDDDATDKLALVKWSPTDDDRWHIIDTTVEDGRARADVEDFSFFTMVRGDLWIDELSIEKAAEDDDDVTVIPVDASAVIDTSGSMSGSKMSDARDAGQVFVDELGDDDQIAVIGFDGNATVHHAMSPDADAAKSAIGGLSAGGGTDIHDGIAAGRGQHNTHGQDDHEQVMVLISDGHSEFNKAVNQAEQAADDGITIHSVAVGGGADENLLKTIANKTAGEFIKVDDSTDLSEAFRDIAENIKYADDDGDGLFDIAETRGIHLAVGPDMGRTVTTNTGEPHTDGDGLTDGDEVELIDRNNIGEDAQNFIEDTLGEDLDGFWIPLAVADPTQSNSDDAGVNDARELHRGTLPLVKRTVHPEQLRQAEADFVKDNPDATAEQINGYLQDEFDLAPLESQTEGGGGASTQSHDDPDPKHTTNEDVKTPPEPEAGKVPTVGRDPGGAYFAAAEFEWKQNCHKVLWLPEAQGGCWAKDVSFLGGGLGDRDGFALIFVGGKARYAEDSRTWMATYDRFGHKMEKYQNVAEIFHPQDELAGGVVFAGVDDWTKGFRQGSGNIRPAVYNWHRGRIHVEFYSEANCFQGDYETLKFRQRFRHSYNQADITGASLNAGASKGGGPSVGVGFTVKDKHDSWSTPRMDWHEFDPCKVKGLP